MSYVEDVEETIQALEWAEAATTSAEEREVFRDLLVYWRGIRADISRLAEQIVAEAVEAGELEIVGMDMDEEGRIQNVRLREPDEEPEEEKP